MSITRRYVHPQEQTIRAAMERAGSGHKIGHSAVAPNAQVPVGSLAIN